MDYCPNLSAAMDPLIEAVKTGSLDAVKQLVSSSGITIDSGFIDYIAVNQSIIDEHEDIAMYLLSQNCRAKCEESTPHQTPLHSAVKRRSSLDIVTKLLSKGASTECLDEQGRSPLHLALILSHKPAIDVILSFIEQTGSYVNVKSPQGLSHFHVACTRKNVKVIEAFVETGIDVLEAVHEDSDYRPGYTAKHFAAEFQSLEAVSVLMKKTNRERRDLPDKNGQLAEDIARKIFEEMSIIVYLFSDHSLPNSETQQISEFHLACAQGNTSLVKKFIDTGASVNDNIASEKFTICPGYSPLHFAVESKCKTNVELLLKENAEVEYQDANFSTPLHLALYNENPDEEDVTIVDLLYGCLSLEDKLSNVMDVFGLNYFHVAVTRNELHLVSDFLDCRGANIEHEVLFNTRQFAHYRPLHFACRYRHLKMVELLIERGADIQAVSKDGSPLHVAVEVGEVDLIDLLLENGAEVDAVRKIDGQTIIHSLVKIYTRNNNDLLLDYIERFVELGCDVNHRDDDGNTALHIACKKIADGIPCVRLLLNFGADVNLENNTGDTPFECAFHDYYRLNADSYMLLYHHVQRLKILGLKMNPKNDDCCQKILDESDECDPNAACFQMAELDRMKQQRRQEIWALKMIKLTKAMSLYGFLKLHRTDATTYVTNGKLMKILQMKNFDEEYPVYGYLIRLQYLRGSVYLNKRKNVKRQFSDEILHTAKRIKLY